MVALTLVAVVTAAVVVARPWQTAAPVLAAPRTPDVQRAVAVDFGVVTDPATDWAALSEHLDRAGATSVDLNAGRVEFTAFDWDAHPDAAAEPGTDHLAHAARALRTGADGRVRDIGLIVDAYVPRWIVQDPSVAGVAADGTRAVYTASATQLARGEVGERLVAYVAALGERYRPGQIAVTELFLDTFSFGDDDLALFREMTGEADWPRTADGTPDEGSELIGTWRSEVLAGLLGRMRAALDALPDGHGTDIALAADARIDWDDPARGVPVAGQDYRILLQAADRLVLWAYLFGEHAPADLERVTADLAAAGYDMSRFTMSVGLWAPTSVDPPGRLSSADLGQAVRDATTHGVADVAVTPLSLMTDQDWDVLAAVWGPEA